MRRAVLAWHLIWTRGRGEEEERRVIYLFSAEDLLRVASLQLPIRSFHSEDSLASLHVGTKEIWLGQAARQGGLGGKKMWLHQSMSA